MPTQKASPKSPVKRPAKGPAKKKAPVQSPGFDLGGDYDEELFTQPSRGSDFPVISWINEYSGTEDMQKHGGYWLSDLEDFPDDLPDGWAQQMIPGSKPGAAPTAVAVTRALIAIPIAVRQCWVRFEDRRIAARYGRFTKYADMPGRPSSMTHVLVCVVGENGEEPVLRQVSLGGKVRGLSWSNNRPGYGGQPLGAYELYCAAISAFEASLREGGYKGPSPPRLCAFSMTLVPLRDEDGPVWIEAGEGHNNPFTFVGEPEYIGPELFQVYQDLRREVGIPFEDEWPVDAGEFAVPTSNGSGVSEDDDWSKFGQPIGTEEDEIAF